GAGELVAEADLIRILKNLERVGHIVRPRDARQITLREPGVLGVALVIVLFLLRERLWLVGDHVAFDDSLAWRHAEMAEEHRVVILNIPGRVVQRLPDAAQVRLALGRARYLIPIIGGSGAH